MRAWIDVKAADVPAGIDTHSANQPGWFAEAMAHAPERGRVVVARAGIETLAWGQRGKPGLLLVHGMAAHADWWDFIAPFFAQDYRVAAFSLSGMGNSDWRDQYDYTTFAQEALACAEYAGLFDAAAKPVTIAHSYGSMAAILGGKLFGDRLGGIVLADCYLNAMIPRPTALGRERSLRYHPTREAVLAQFRLSPPQQAPEAALVDHIAAYSVTEDEGLGWRWKFDPTGRQRTRREDIMAALAQVRCPVAMMRGARSTLVSREMAVEAASNAPGRVPLIELPDADHHLFLDQPLAFVAALRALLAVWPEGGLDHRPTIER